MLRGLLGETSLERKCRLLFGLGFLILLGGTIFWYSEQMEKLIFSEMRDKARLVTSRLFLKDHWGRLETKDFQPTLDALLSPLLPEEMPVHSWRYIDAKAKPTVGQPPPGMKQQPPLDEFEKNALKRLLAKDYRVDIGQEMPGRRSIYQYARAVRWQPACQGCHPGGKPNEFMALMSVRLNMERTREAIFWNWAILIAAGLVLIALAMGAIYLIVRFVIVGPVKHLVRVADQVTAGNLDVRSEIHTGDEFEDLGLAFNRMLRHLQATQDELRRVNETLDAKFDELAQANMALYEMNRLKSEFLSMITHELRTPLNSILGFSDVLLGGTFGTLTDRQKRYVDNIRTSGSQLLNMINDVLDLAKIESGRMEINVSEFSLYDLCEGLMNVRGEMAEKKKLTLTTDLAPDIPILRTDRTKLQQILDNLLSNAIKFTPEGGRVTLAARADGEHLVLTVADTGVGISEADQKIIFDKFRQADAGLTRQTAGTGLGLSIVKELSRLLGGTVSLESTLGHGSTFTVRLPVHLAEERQYLVPIQSAVDLTKAKRFHG